MRIDKYLKSSRLIKRRTVAKDLAESGVVFINGKKAKPSDEIKVADELRLVLGRREIIAIVTSINDKPIKGVLAPMYDIKSDRKLDEPRAPK